MGEDENTYTAGIFSNKLDAEKHAAVWPGSPEVVEYELDELNSILGLTSWEISLNSEGSFLCIRNGETIFTKNEFCTTSVGFLVRGQDGEWKGRTTLPDGLYCRVRVMAKDEEHAKELAAALYAAAPKSTCQCGAESYKGPSISHFRGSGKCLPCQKQMVTEHPWIQIDNEEWKNA